MALSEPIYAKWRQLQHTKPDEPSYRQNRTELPQVRRASVRAVPVFRGVTYESSYRTVPLEIVTVARGAAFSDIYIYER